jgi:hypothetical protein
MPARTEVDIPVGPHSALNADARRLGLPPNVAPRQQLVLSSLRTYVRAAISGPVGTRAHRVGRPACETHGCSSPRSAVVMRYSLTTHSRGVCTRDTWAAPRPHLLRGQLCPRRSGDRLTPCCPWRKWGRASVTRIGLGPAARDAAVTSRRAPNRSALVHAKN